MTKQEQIKKAIRHFECMKNDAVVVLDSGFGTRKGESDTIYRNRKMYAELAIKALEKQIPKKPNRCIGSMVTLFVCPYCQRKQPIMYEQYHCKKCGQKLDWGNEK